MGNNNRRSIGHLVEELEDAAKPRVNVLEPSCLRGGQLPERRPWRGKVSKNDRKVAVLSRRWRTSERPVRDHDDDKVRKSGIKQWGWSALESGSRIEGAPLYTPATPDERLRKDSLGAPIEHADPRLGR